MAHKIWLKMPMLDSHSLYAVCASLLSRRHHKVYDELEMMQKTAQVKVRSR